MAKTTRKNAVRFLSAVPEEYVFRCNDGRVMRDIKELAQALNDMSDETFAYHVNETKNDFGNWVQDVIGDKALASNLRKVLARTEAVKVVAARAAFLSSRAA